MEGESFQPKTYCLDETFETQISQLVACSDNPQ